MDETFYLDCNFTFYSKVMSQYEQLLFTTVYSLYL